MRVSVFTNVKSSTPQKTDLDKIVVIMRTNQKICNMTTEYRNSIATSSKKNLERLKINFFPAFCPAAILYNGKSRENVMGLTDLCFIDIDHIKTEKKVDMAMSILRDDRNVLLASRSVSGNGIHILVRYRIKDEDVAPQIDTFFISASNVFCA